MIIIFLIFLNLFITAYFYFTSLITANANRSNCGAGGLTEAETFRHIFLQDNGNDKTRDIYIIIVAIFAIYMFSEMFKIFEMSDFDINDNHKYIGSILSIILVCVLFIINIYNSVTLKEYGKRLSYLAIVILSFFIAIIYLLYQIKSIGFKDWLDTRLNDKNKFINKTNAFIVLMFICFVVEISNISNNKFDKDNEYKLINPKFNENTAMVLMFSVFFILCGIHTGVYGFKSINSWYYLLLLFLVLCLFMFILVSSLDLSFNKNIDDTDTNADNTYYQLKTIIEFFLAFKWFALLIPFIILICILINNFVKKESLIDPTPFIKTLVFYYVLLFVAFLFYVYFMNKESTTGILSLQYFQLYNYNSENSNENIKNTTDGKYNNFYKELNISNFTFVGFFLIILIILLTFAKNNKSTNNLIYGMIVFIISSYVTGVVYLIYNTLFPIQKLSFKYKKNLIDINNEISNHIKSINKEHSIDKNKIFNFNTFSLWSDVKGLQEIIKATSDKTKKEKLEIIKNEFRKIAPKGDNYDKYVDQSKDQKEYEEYILNIFDDVTSEKTFSILKDYTIEKYIQKIFKEINPIIEPVLELQNPELALNTEEEITNLRVFLEKDIIKKATQADKDILKDILTKPYANVSSKLTSTTSGKSDTLTHIKNISSNEYNYAILNINKRISVIFDKPTKTQQETNIINNIIPTIMEILLSKTNDELKLEIYRKLIIDVPKNLNELKDNNDIKYFSKSTKLDIPVSNNLEYIIKKNYKYVTGEEGELQIYNAKSNTFIDNNKTLTPTELNGKYWIKIPNGDPKAHGFKTNNDNYYQTDNQTDIITVTPDATVRNFYFYTSEPVIKISNSNEIHNKNIADILNTQTTDSNEINKMEEGQKKGKLNKLENVFETIKIDNTHTIYRMKDYFFEKVKSEFEKAEEKDIHFFALNVYPMGLNLFVSYNVINTDIKTINSEDIDLIASYKNKNIIDKINDRIIEPFFYTIGYDYNNYKEEEEENNKNKNQVILRDKLYALPAKYYACAYLNYHPRSDESMNTKKFKDYIDEKHYEIYNPDKNNIVTKIAKSYDTIVEDTKKDLDPNMFNYLLIFLVILAIVLLMFIFNLIKKYFTDDIYTSQMYVLGILAVFLTVFIFGEVIFSRIK
jgi:hypothetical protein